MNMEIEIGFYIVNDNQGQDADSLDRSIGSGLHASRSRQVEQRAARFGPSLPSTNRDGGLSPTRHFRGVNGWIVLGRGHEYSIMSGGLRPPDRWGIEVTTVETWIAI